MIQHTKPALHISMMSMLSKCGQMFAYRYVEGIKAPPGVALVVGTAVHQACELDLQRKMETGQPAPADEVREKAASALDATWLGEGVLLDEEEKKLGEKLVRADAKDEAVSLALLANREVTPFLEPVMLEHKIRLVLPNFPFDIEGAMDVVEEYDASVTNEAPELIRRRVRDRKTAKKSPSGNEAEGHPQLDLYSMMLTHEDPTKPVGEIALDYLVKTVKPKAVTVTARAPKNFDAIKARLVAAANVIEKGAFMPVDPTGPSGWVCSERWCGYWDRCPFGRARKVQV